MAWTTPRTWVPGELVTASMMNLHVRDNLNYLYGNTKTFSYLVTTTPLANSITETDIAHFTVTGGNWSDGEEIRMRVPCLFKQNTGTNRTAIFKVNAGAGAQVQLKPAGGGLAGTGLFSNDSATEFKIYVPVFLRRVGADVWISHWEYPLITETDAVVFPANTFSAIQQQIDGISTPANFSSDVIITLKATLDNANANYYVTPKVNYATHVKN